MMDLTLRASRSAEEKNRGAVGTSENDLLRCKIQLAGRDTASRERRGGSDEHGGDGMFDGERRAATETGIPGFHFR